MVRGSLRLCAVSLFLIAAHFLAQSLDPAQHHQQVAGMQPGHAFNSQDYVQDVMNLSVELDPHLDTAI
ncbi:hypothetical protein HaLaN_19072 [Haematococcus lacustris]|uniref:Uncharacterized protein n=1 Tax=Haematococcus lacustris TaxID=44745 RepID=A0A699ZSI1_HAELA|nr:hypothetical protein HaLaN_19072 [Haematococcus lacustris]